MIKSNTTLYKYQAPLKQGFEVRSSVTTRDENGHPVIQTVISWMQHSDQIVSGYLEATDGEEAATLALAALLEHYPTQKGYREHEKVAVKEMEKQP